jgi:hypothetical protein
MLHRGIRYELAGTTVTLRQRFATRYNGALSTLWCDSRRRWKELWQPGHLIKVTLLTTSCAALAEAQTPTGSSNRGCIARPQRTLIPSFQPVVGFYKLPSLIDKPRHVFRVLSRLFTSGENLIGVDALDRSDVGLAEVGKRSRRGDS